MKSSTRIARLRLKSTNQKTRRGDFFDVSDVGGDADPCFPVGDGAEGFDVLSGFSEEGETGVAVVFHIFFQHHLTSDLLLFDGQVEGSLTGFIGT